MCGRYTGNDDESQEMFDIYSDAQKHYPSAQMKHGEIFPADTAPILFGKEMLAVPAKWGFPTYNGKGVLINARAETANERPSFAESLMLRRCIIPTTGYLEWNSDKQKFRFNRPGEQMLYLGGFCKRIGNEARFVVLTTAPNESVSDIHNRMPIILNSDSDELMRWNYDTEWAMKILKSTMPLLEYISV